MYTNGDIMASAALLLLLTTYPPTPHSWAQIAHNRPLHVSCAFALQEIIMVLWFTLEYCLRLWSAGCRFRYQACIGRIRFARKPLCIVGRSTAPVANAAPFLLLRLSVGNQPPIMNVWLFCVVSKEPVMVVIWWCRWWRCFLLNFLHSLIWHLC